MQRLRKDDDPRNSKTFPDKGSPKEEVFAALKEYKKDDLDWRSGRVWAYTYHDNTMEEIEQVAKHAYMEFLTESGLDPTVFPSLMRFENELVSMSANHVNGGPDVVGNFTSGGTESIMLAVKTARDWARAHRPHITKPNMVLPVTAHAAFHKAGQYMDVETKTTPVDSTTFRALVEPMREAVDENTILIVGSAPSYGHGVIDPMEEIGQVAVEKDILYHVDACMGGFALPYFRRLGEDIPPFGFEVPGVTSLSMDLHKYAYTPKGASIILYKDKDLRRHQIFSFSQWTGYTMINNTIQSTKTGGPIAAAWATVKYLGDDGYLKLAEKALRTRKAVVDGINRIPKLRVLSHPQMTLVGFTSDEVNVFHIIDEMKERGWYVQPQLAYDNSPANIHLSINPSNEKWVDAVLADLAECVEVAAKLPKSDLAETVQQMFASINPDDLTPEMFSNMLNMAGVQGHEVPERMAEINMILDALPPLIRERLLGEFVNDLFVYRGE
ncbi:aspartate aminotransferase family protein [bacterium]|nr:aspartate aminotransferase family protein [bacterium]MCB9476177.1 aspartate aminotransferase family protein [Deltaproteobacteria bacterium]